MLIFAPTRERTESLNRSEQSFVNKSLFPQFTPVRFWCGRRFQGNRPTWARLFLLTLIGIASGPAAWALDQTAPVITAASTTVGPVQFEAIWPDGTRLQAVDVEGWRGDGRGAKIGGRSLFVAPMVRTLRNLSIPARLPG